MLKHKEKRKKVNTRKIQRLGENMKKRRKKLILPLDCDATYHDTMGVASCAMTTYRDTIFLFQPDTLVAMYMYFDHFFKSSEF